MSEQVSRCVFCGEMPYIVLAPRGVCNWEVSCDNQHLEVVATGIDRSDAIQVWNDQIEKFGERFTITKK